MSQVFSNSRPLHGSKPQTAQHQALEKYALDPGLQDLVQQMLADLFSEQPDDYLQYMINWLQAEQTRRNDLASEANSTST